MKKKTKEDLFFTALIYVAGLMLFIYCVRIMAGSTNDTATQYQQIGVFIVTLSLLLFLTFKIKRKTFLNSSWPSFLALFVHIGLIIADPTKAYLSDFTNWASILHHSGFTGIFFAYLITTVFVAMVVPILWYKETPAE